MYVQVQKWRETHGADLLYFQPATQEEEVLTDDLEREREREKMIYCMWKV